MLEHVPLSCHLIWTAESYVDTLSHKLVSLDLAILVHIR